MSLMFLLFLQSLWIQSAPSWRQAVVFVVHACVYVCVTEHTRPLGQARQTSLTHGGLAFTGVLFRLSFETSSMELTFFL